MPAYHLIDLLLVATAFIILPVQSVIAGRKFTRADRNEATVLARYRLIIARAFLISAVILLAWVWLGRPFSALGLGLPIGTPGLIGFILPLILIGRIIHMVLIKAFPPETRALLRKQLDSLHITPQTRAEFNLFPLVVLTGSLMEELFFRGYLFWALTPVAGLWGAVALSTAIFGLSHAYQGLAGIVRTGLIGLFYGIGFALTHSLWWLMLLHVTMNMTGYFLARKLNHPSATPAT